MAYPRVWLVERYLPAQERDGLERLADQTKAAIRTLRAMDIEILHLGSTLIPRDETCFCAFMAPAKRVIEQLNYFVDAPSLRIDAGVHLRSLEPVSAYRTSTLQPWPGASGLSGKRGIAPAPYTSPLSEGNACLLLNLP